MQLLTHSMRRAVATRPKRYQVVLTAEGDERTDWGSAESSARKDCRQGVPHGWHTLPHFCTVRLCGRESIRCCGGSALDGEVTTHGRGAS